MPILEKMRLLLALVAATTLCAETATLDGRPIHYSSYGKGSKTVVLLHGWTCDETFWENQTAALSKKYRVITIDLPGHGQSAAPAAYTQENFARAVDAVLLTARVKSAVLIGHSLGAITARQYARLYLDRARAIVMIDPPMFKAPISTGLRQFASGFGGPDGPKARAEFVKSMFAESTPGDLRQKILTKMAQPSEAVAVGAMNSLLEDKIWDTQPMSLPVMMIVEGGNNTTKEPMRQLFPSLRFEKISGAGHFLMLEKPDEINKLLLQYLKEVF